MTYLIGDQNDNYPYSSVVLVYSTFADGSAAIGSGVMVGPNDVLTAAHCLWDADTGYATSVAVYPGYDDGSAPFGAIAAARWDSYQWDTLGANQQPGSDGLLYESESQWDVGIIGLSTNVGYQTGWMGIDPGGYSGWYFQTGYPSDYNNPLTGAPVLSEDYGYASYDDTYWTYNYLDNFSIFAGNSGGPLWYDANPDPAVVAPYVIGVCSSDSWAADVGFTFDTVLAWMNNDYLLA
jgi:V8-like Glu-specific endopeptidase